MDDIVFAREAMRRDLLKQLELVEKAGESYDPEADAPTDDMIAAALIVMSAEAQAYIAAVHHRVELRTAAKEPGS